MSCSANGNAIGEYDWSEFDAIKQVFLEPARRPVFHYAIYADLIADTTLAGLSRDFIAADFILAAGHPKWNGGLTATQEASLFIHELGHNLGLRHGGGDNFNNKPNYFSSMNYLLVAHRRSAGQPGRLLSGRRALDRRNGRR